MVAVEEEEGMAAAEMVETMVPELLELTLLCMGCILTRIVLKGLLMKLPLLPGQIV